MCVMVMVNPRLVVSVEERLQPTCADARVLQALEGDTVVAAMVREHALARLPLHHHMAGIDPTSRRIERRLL